MRQTFTDLILLKAGVSEEELKTLKSNDTVKLSCLFKNEIHEDTKASASITKTKGGFGYMYNCFSCGAHGSEVTLLNKIILNENDENKFTKKDNHNIYNLIDLFGKFNKLKTKPFNNLDETKLSKSLKVIFGEDITNLLSDTEATLKHLNDLRLLTLEEVNNRHFSGDIAKINITNGQDILFDEPTNIELSIERYPKNNSNTKSKMPKAIKNISYTDVFVPLNDIWNENKDIDSLLSNYVFITEGEKDMLLLRLFNLRAFSFLNGANAFKVTNNNIKILSSIYKEKTFVLLGDNDDAGSLFNNQVAKAIFKNNPDARVINFSNIMVKNYDLENKEDITDLFLKYFNNQNDFIKYIKKELSNANLEKNTTNTLLDWFYLFNKENDTVSPSKEILFDNLYKYKNNHYYTSVAHVANVPTFKNNNNLGINKSLNFSILKLTENENFSSGSLKSQINKFIESTISLISSIPANKEHENFEIITAMCNEVSDYVNNYLFFSKNNNKPKDIDDYAGTFTHLLSLFNDIIIHINEMMRDNMSYLNKKASDMFSNTLKDGEHINKILSLGQLYVTLIEDKTKNKIVVLPSFIFNESKEANKELKKTLHTLDLYRTKHTKEIYIEYVPIKALYTIDKAQLEMYNEITSFVFDSSLNKYLFNWEQEFYSSAEINNVIESFSFAKDKNGNEIVFGNINSLLVIPYLELIKNKILNNKDKLATMDEIIFPLLQNYLITLFNADEKLLKSLNILLHIQNKSIKDGDLGVIIPDIITNKLVKKPSFIFLNVNEVKISQEQHTFIPIDFTSPKNNPFFSLSNMNNKEYTKLKDKDIPGKVDLKERITTYYILQDAFENIKNAEQDDLIRYSFIYSKSLKGGDLVGYIVEANIVEKNDEFLKDIKPTLESFRNLYKDVKTYKDIEKISYGIYENMLKFNGGKKYSYKLHETYDLTFNSLASYTSIGKEGNKQYNLKAALATFIAGDSGEGKSSTFVALQEIYEAGSKTAASNITADAIIGGTATDTRKINKGEFTKNHNKLLAIEEVANLTADNPQSTSKLFGKLNDGIKDGVIKLSRVDDVLDTHAMTRFLAMSNPTPKRTSFKTNNNGGTFEIASYEKQNPEDSHLQLFHSIVPMKSFWNRMNIKFLVTKQVREIGKELAEVSVKTNFSKQDFKFKLMWLWNLTYKNVSVTEDVIEYARQIANDEFIPNYRAVDRNYKNVTNEDISIGDIGSITDDLIRIGFAFAGLMVDTEDFKSIKLQTKHIDIAKEYLISVFDITNIKSTIDKWKQSKLLDDEHINKLIFNDLMFKQESLPFKTTDQNGQWQEILKFVNSIAVINKPIKNGLSYYTTKLKENQSIVDIFDEIEFDDENATINGHALRFYEAIIKDIHINESSQVINRQELEQRLETLLAVSDLPNLVPNNHARTSRYVALLTHLIWQESKIIYLKPQNQNSIVINYEKFVMVYNKIKEEVAKIEQKKNIMNK